jgi:hypothetical protein
MKSATHRKSSTSKGWANVKLQGVTVKDAYALEITGNPMMPV